MAKQKQLVLDSGVTCDYHRIVQLNCNYDILDASCTLAIYIDEAARLAGKSPLDTVKVDLAGEFHNANYTDDEDAMKNISLKEAYKAIGRMAVSIADKVAQDSEYSLDSNEENVMIYADAEDV